MSDYQRSCSIRGDGGRAIRSLLDRVGDKWSLLVVATLDGRALRFTELLAQVPGVSQRMLTRTVRHLERDGLLTRTAYAEVPPRVEYELTPLGRSLIGPAAALADWALAHEPSIEEHRRTHGADED